jgi:RNA polymerase sigma factor (sigma-70 family)
LNDPAKQHATDNSAADLDDAELAVRCAASTRDEDAWVEMRRRFHDLLRWKTANLLSTRDLSEIDDYVSEVWIHLLTHIGRYEPERGPFRSFLLALARNHIIDLLRRPGGGAWGWERGSSAEPSAVGPPMDLLASVVETVVRELKDERKKLVFERLQYGDRVSQIASEYGLDVSFVRRTRDSLARRVVEVLDEVLPDEKTSAR